MRSIFLPVCQLQQSHPPWDQVPLQRDPSACEDCLDQGRLALLPTAKKETAEKPPKERKPKSMIRLLPQFPSQLKICLMLEKINSVIIIKIRLLPSSVAGIWFPPGPQGSWKEQNKKKTKQKPHSPTTTNPCPQKKRRAKFKLIWLETIWFENNIKKKKT